MKINKCLNCGKDTKNKKFCSLSCSSSFNSGSIANKVYGEYKEFKVKCFKCGDFFITRERESLFPQKEKYFCSRSCANSKIHSLKTKEKISNSLKVFNESAYENKKCELSGCNNVFFVIKSKKQKFCSTGCSINSLIERGHYSKNGKIGGRLSAEIQAKNRRNKNEKYFAELCEEKFDKVLTNESIFNGWDADIIIEDLKIAIFWNGKWHYEKITEKHSVKQVQNRDKIKIKEIKEKGYKPYIIKDMGKQNEKKVKMEFEKFLKKYKIK